MGYPLLSENSVVTLSENGVTPRNEHAASGIDKALVMEEPQSDFEEQCYYFNMTKGEAKIYSPDIDTSLSLNYDTRELPFFTEWKMMGTGEYVLGLEPGNCTPDGRDVMRANGTLSFINPCEEKTQTIKIKVNKGC
jgi:galactose mutarotase-like enzyme